MLIDDVSNEIAKEGVPSLVSYINGTIRSCRPDSEDEGLNYLVKKYKPTIIRRTVQNHIKLLVDLDFQSPFVHKQKSTWQY